MAPEREDKMSGFPRGEAKPALAEIMRRYGIHPPGQQGEGRRELDAPKVRTKKLSPGPLNSSPSTTHRQLSLVAPPLNMEWRHSSSQPPASESVHPIKEPTLGPAGDKGFEPEQVQLPKEHYDFHFLIRILECSVTLHCQVSAESAADAKDKVQRIPNLLEWRETSAEEIAQITRNERS